MDALRRLLLPFTIEEIEAAIADIKAFSPEHKRPITDLLAAHGLTFADVQAGDPLLAMLLSRLQLHYVRVHNNSQPYQYDGVTVRRQVERDIQWTRAIVDEIRPMLERNHDAALAAHH